MEVKERHGEESERAGTATGSVSTNFLATNPGHGNLDRTRDLLDMVMGTHYNTPNFEGSPTTPILSQPAQPPSVPVGVRPLTSSNGEEPASIRPLPSTRLPSHGTGPGYLLNVVNQIQSNPNSYLGPSRGPYYTTTRPPINLDFLRTQGLPPANSPIFTQAIPFHVTPRPYFSPYYSGREGEPTYDGSAWIPMRNFPQPGRIDPRHPYRPYLR